MPTIDALRSTVTDLLGDGSPPPADHDDLIELGLDSIRIMRIADRLRREGVTVSFADLARRPTLAEWERLAGAGAGPAPARRGGQTGGAAPSGARGRPPPAPSRRRAVRAGPDAARLLGRPRRRPAARRRRRAPVHRVRRPRRRPRAARRAPSRALVARHDMLRARVLDDGRQVIDPPRARRRAARSRPARTRPAGEVAGAHGALRDELSHQLLRPRGGQVFDVRLTLLPGGAHAAAPRRRHAGRRRAQLPDPARRARARSTSDPDEPLPAARLRLRALPRRPRARSAAPRARTCAGGASGSASCPARPQLPWRAEHDAGRSAPRRAAAPLAATRSMRGRLTDAARRARRDPGGGGRRRRSPRSLGAWSATPRFLLNVPLFDRRPLHPDVDAIVGDFTSSVLLDVDLQRDADVRASAPARCRRGCTRASRTARTPGLDVLRDLVARARASRCSRRSSSRARSASASCSARDVERCFGEPAGSSRRARRCCSTPRSPSCDGGLLVNWDVRDGRVPRRRRRTRCSPRSPRVLDRLGASRRRWAEPVGALAAAPASAARARARSTPPPAPLPQRPLHDGVLRARRARPPAGAGGARRRRAR